MSDTPHEHSESHGKAHKSHGGGHGGGGHDEEHAGAPEWLISFADNVVLMMGFFVILLAMNMAKQTEEAMLDFTLGVREAFNNPVDMNSKDPKEEALRQRLIQRAGRSETRSPGVKGHEHDVQSIRPSAYYALSGSVPFPENSAELLAPAQP